MRADPISVRLESTVLFVTAGDIAFGARRRKDIACHQCLQGVLLFFSQANLTLYKHAPISNVQLNFDVSSEACDQMFVSQTE